MPSDLKKAAGSSLSVHIQARECTACLLHGGGPAPAGECPDRRNPESSAPRRIDTQDCLLSVLYPFHRHHRIQNSPPRCPFGKKKIGTGDIVTNAMAKGL